MNDQALAKTHPMKTEEIKQSSYTFVQLHNPTLTEYIILIQSRQKRKQQ